MSDKFNQLIELLIAEDEEKAQELFHEIVVERSRSIYENLIDEETVDEEDEVAEEEAVEESDFDEELGGDAADDMIDDIEADEEGLAVEAHDDDEEIEDRVVDLEDALDELKAEFEKIMGDDEEEGPEMDMDMDDEMDMDMEMGDDEADEDDEDEMESAYESEEVVREYKEKAKAPVTSEEGDGSAGPVAGKNDMGGKSVDPTGEEKGGSAPKATVQTDAADPKGATMSKA
jgi:hypothetical protein